MEKRREKIYEILGQHLAVGRVIGNIIFIANILFYCIIKKYKIKCHLFSVYATFKGRQ